MQAIDYQPSILLQTNTLLMSIRMSIMTMSNTNTEVVPNTSDIAAQTTSMSETAPAQPKTMSSSIPLEEDGEQIKASNVSAIQHKKNQIKRLLTETWLRVALIVSTLFAIVFFTVLFKTASTDPVAQDAGDGSTSMVVTGIPDGADNLNPAQAEYLRERNRQEAAEQARSGVTNAPSLILPKATVVGVDSNAVSDASAFTVGSTKSYYTKEESDPNDVKTMSLASDGRFSPVGASKLDEEANQLAIERARVAAASVQAKPGVDPAIAKANASNATYNINQNGGANNGNNGANNGGNNGANNGGNNGGDTGASAAANNQNQPQERQPDADLPIVQQRLYDSYNQQMQELQAQEERLAAQQAANQQQVAQLRQQRQQQAAQALASQMQSQAQKRTGGGFTSKKYMPEQNTNNSDNSSNGTSNNNQNIGYWPAQPTASGYQPSAYSNNSSYGNQGRFTSESNAATPPPLLPKNIIRAGTRWPVVITKHVNTDEGLNVSGVIVGGPFDGDAVHGSVQQQGRNIGVVFNRIEPQNPRKQIIPLNALAQTIGSQKEAVASQVKNHYAQNYGIMALTSIIGGYGEAYSDNNETVITGSDGFVIESKGETTQKEVTAEILSQFSDKLNEDIGSLGNRPPTFIINQGTVLQMVLLSNLDIYGTVNGSANSGQPQQPQQQYSNTRRTSL